MLNALEEQGIAVPLASSADGDIMHGISPVRTAAGVVPASRGHFEDGSEAVSACPEETPRSIRNAQPSSCVQTPYDYQRRADLRRALVDHASCQPQLRCRNHPTRLIPPLSARHSHLPPPTLHTLHPLTRPRISSLQRRRRGRHMDRDCIRVSCQHGLSRREYPGLSSTGWTARVPRVSLHPLPDLYPRQTSASTRVLAPDPQRLLAHRRSRLRLDCCLRSPRQER